MENTAKLQSVRAIQTQIDAVNGDIITVKANPGVSIGEIASVGGSKAIVVKLDKGNAFLQMLEGARGVFTQNEITFLGVPQKISSSEAVLGRVFNGLGEPIDGGPDVSEDMESIITPSINPASRTLPSKMVRTGIPMIDVFNSLVESQKIPIFTTSQEPYNELMVRIALNTDADVVILGGIGMRFEEYDFYRTSLEEGGVFSKCAFYVHQTQDSPLIATIVPDTCLTVAERFAISGKRVLVILSDMTKFADAMKEVANAMDRVPANRSYPGDLYTQLARRYEKAVAFKDGGSVTIMGVTTMPSNDVTHPVPDNTGYITEGQFYLDNGVIQLAGSLSRLKQLVNKKTRDDHAPIADYCAGLYADCAEVRELKSMGFRIEAFQEKLLRFGEEFEKRIMDLSIAMPLENALDELWKILSEIYTREEVTLNAKLVEKYWPSV
jgi:V/A-type H+-transporting ATPase subunit B